MGEWQEEWSDTTKTHLTLQGYPDYHSWTSEIEHPKVKLWNISKNASKQHLTVATGYDATNHKETCPELLEGNDCFPEPVDTTSPPKENDNNNSPPSPEEAGQPEESKPEGPENEGL